MNGYLRMTGEYGEKVPADALPAASFGSETGKNVWVDRNHCPHHIGHIGAAMHNGRFNTGIIEDQAAVRAVKAIETFSCMKML